jgi:hypothetical protein
MRCNFVLENRLVFPPMAATLIDLGRFQNVFEKYQNNVENKTNKRLCQETKNVTIAVETMH